MLCQTLLCSSVWAVIVAMYVLMSLIIQVYLVYCTFCIFWIHCITIDRQIQLCAFVHFNFLVQLSIPWQIDMIPAKNVVSRLQPSTNRRLAASRANVLHCILSWTFLANCAPVKPFHAQILSVSVWVCCCEYGELSVVPCCRSPGILLSYSDCPSYDVIPFKYRC